MYWGWVVFVISAPKSMTNFRIGRNREGDICYRCKEQGHWSVDCPTKNPAVCTKYCPTPPPPTRFWGQENGLEYSPPLLVCRCGLPCPLRISTNPTNFNRPFYACPVTSSSFLLYLFS